jgi:hypothetical protein
MLPQFAFAPLDEAGVDAIVDAAMRGLAPGD